MTEVSLCAALTALFTGCERFSKEQIGNFHAVCFLRVYWGLSRRKPLYSVSHQQKMKVALSPEHIGYTSTGRTNGEGLTRQDHQVFDECLGNDVLIEIHCA